MSNPVQLIEQKRARFALDAVQKFVSKDDSDQKSFVAYARQLPAMIQTNGLGQAAAFYKAKGTKSKAYNELYQLLGKWLSREQAIYPEEDLITAITQNDMHCYRLAQAEVQALLIWVKKFAEALCDKEKTGGNKND
ncbi:type III-B CRISPR module-associated protein Cmr5 [Gynuella sunshinyii]|uniref:CRISPR type III-B/RAMP module-associated protein Cmr5 n=1 Tax=Gynuella sunshinyii YC6258 TaxID=1445510 RepID=A0A0C5VIL6_9GAMM|nr:type III-B CRISPR module-associated protein Cmr5 [Gynuella sunshinyii]AJQ93188.1 uncharacterized protein predicted to be involved in DNA repair [Gynuella sunshinyii YC6258]